jgi:hypothetical protein
MAAVLVQSKRARAAQVRKRARECAKAIEQMLLECGDFKCEFSRPPVEEVGVRPWVTYAPGPVVYVSLKVFPKPGK